MTETKKEKSIYDRLNLTPKKYIRKFGLSKDDLLKLIIRYLAFKHPGEIVDTEEFLSEVNRIHRALWEETMELEEILP